MDISVSEGTYGTHHTVQPGATRHEWIHLIRTPSHCLPRVHSLPHTQPLLTSPLTVTPTSITITWNLTAEDEGSVNGFHLSHHAVGIPLQGSNVLGQFELLPSAREWTISPLEEGLTYNITFDVVLRGQFDGPSIVQRSTFLVSTPETGNHGNLHTATYIHEKLGT